MCMACKNVANDAGRMERFSATMLERFNAAAVVLMTSIGHRAGLFDAMADGAMRSSAELAQKAELNERYVREWLGAMATAGMVEMDDAGRRFRLPPDHAAFLTRAATPNNMAATAQWLSVLGSVEDQVVEAFSHGRGVPYAMYHRFREVMAEESQQTTVAALADQIIPMVDGLHERLERGCDVIDVGCGMGWALMAMARRYPRSRFVGIDLLEEHVAEATAMAEREGLDNVEFRRADAATWKEPTSYDVVFTFDAIHDQARPDLVLGNIARALRPNGVYVMQDIKASSDVRGNMDRPLAPFIYTISCMHCMSVSLAAGGMGLGAAWGRELAEKMLRGAGFGHVEVRELPHDTMNYYYTARR